MEDKYIELFKLLKNKDVFYLIGSAVGPSPYPEMVKYFQKIIGEEIGADGYEISVHSNPAPDHELVQGRQFSLEEYEKLRQELLNKYDIKTFLTY